MIKLTSLIFSSIVSLISHAQELSIERIFAGPSLDGDAPRNLQISPDGQRVTFLKGKQTDYEQLDLWEYHIPSGETRLLFDSHALPKGGELSDEEKARRERLRLSAQGIVSYQWSKDGSALLFPLGGDAIYNQVGSKKVKQLLNTPAFETDIKLSPKGNYLSFIREKNLVIKHIQSGKETAITTQGDDSIKYGMAEFVAQEEMGRLTGHWWSPDEQHIAFTRVDESPVELVTRSEIYADGIKLIQQRYPRAGSANADVSLAIQNIASGKRDWVELAKGEKNNKDIYLARVDWMPSSTTLAYQWQSRDQKTLELRTYELKSRKQKRLLREISSTWVNLHKDLHFLKKQEAFIWASERDGFKHLYLYNNNGQLIQQLTKGAWVVDEVEAVDEVNNRLYFTGRKDSVLERHLYRVNLDGKQLQRVSRKAGFHDIDFSPDATIYVDKASAATQPPQVRLHAATGEAITWLTENAIVEGHPLYSFQQQWIEPEFASIKTDDGTALFYRLYKPTKLKKKNPAIVYLYGGPGVQIVANKWGKKRDLLLQYWAQQGFVVFSLDNRGSKFRGKAFEDPIYQKMGGIEVADQVAGVKFLSSLPYVDKTRIGVYGHSYGGYMALMSMFKAGEYFAAGVSGAPVTDWRLYDTHYTERFMGNPNREAAAYTAASVFPYAHNLQGPLLIYHGMADDNVLFTHSTKLYKHLQDQAIVFESMNYPGKKHSIRGKQTGVHLYKTITQFFVRHLNLHP